MGRNRWPVDACAEVDAGLGEFYAAASEVAHTRDGGVVVTVAGTVLEQMVRFRDVRPDDVADGERLRSADYDPWMGARHMSAYDTSLRPDVVATITLSEESGRVTVFRDGRYASTRRTEIGGPWRVPGE